MTDAGSVRPVTRGLAGRVQPLPVLALACAWTFMWGSFTPVTIVGGILLAVVVTWLFPLPPLHLGLRVRPWPLLVLLVRFFVDLVVASVHVAYQSVAPWVHPRGHVIDVDLRGDDDLFAVITAEMTALVPGTVVIDLDVDARRLVLHVFDSSEEDLPRVAERVRAQEERVLRALARDADRLLEDHA